MGNSLSTLKSIDYNDDNKVEGCASQVWLVVEEIDKQGKTPVSYTHLTLPTKA